MTTPTPANTPTPTPTPTPPHTWADNYRAGVARLGIPGNPAVATALERAEDACAEESKRYAADLGKYERHSDSGNAEEMAARYSDRLRYVPAWGWVAYEDGVWHRDSGDTLAARYAKDTLRQLVKEAADIEGDDERRDQLRHLSHSFNRIGQMVDIAKSCEPFTTDVTAFDAHPWLVNLKNGVYDLEHGEFVQHSAAYLLTKQAPVEYHHAATAPAWDAALRGIFNDDPDLMAYVQRALGYSLTADVREDAFFVCFGTGGNGKSTMLNAVMAVMGDYAQPLKADALMTQQAGSGGAATPELARLLGARFVTAQEPRRGSLDTSRVKELTGRDPMQVRELYREPFTLIPTFKLWLSTNERPDVPEQTVGIWRRIRLIPFTRSFAAKPNTDLPVQLRAEASGILNWLLEGVRQWRAHGLGTAKAVNAATHEYHEQNDPQLEFFTDWLVPDEANWGRVSVHDAYMAYQKWYADALKRSGVFEKLGERQFGKVAENHGYARVKGTGGTRCLTGCRLATADERRERERAREADPPVAIVAINESFPITFPRENSLGKVYGKEQNIATNATPDPDPATLSRADLRAAVAAQAAEATSPARPGLDPATCPHDTIASPNPERATWRCEGCGHEWPEDACPLLSESYWHLHLTPSAETLARYAEDGEEPTPPCRHLLAYPPKPGHEARYENHWTCPDCGDTLWCEHPAEHALTYWRNRGCIACTIAGMRDKLTQDLTATTSGPVRSEDAPADPALKGWALALSRVPTCPNPNHEHRGFRCSTSGLPLAYGQWERLRQQPFELEYDATGQPSNVKRTVRVMEAMWQDEAVACYLIDVLHADLPADHPMRQRYDKLHAAYEREVAKLTCPHKHKTYTAGKILGKMLITVCKDCGAYLSTGVPR